MARTRFPADRGLTTRMVVVMFLLGLLYVSAMAGLIAAGVDWFLVVLIAAGALVAQWYFSDKPALAAMGAHEGTPEEAPELHAMIDRLCALPDKAQPRAAAPHMQLRNALANGRTPPYQ